MSEKRIDTAYLKTLKTYRRDVSNGILNVEGLIEICNDDDNESISFRLMSVSQALLEMINARIKDVEKGE